MFYLLTSTQKALVLFAAVVPQYIMALICVVLMAMLNIKFKYKLILNFVIMLVPYLGWIGFLIYYIGWGRHNKMDYKSPAKTASPEGSEPADKDNETTDK